MPDPDTRQLAAAFGQRLRHYRTVAHLTQHEVGARTGHNRSYIADLERGAHVPNLATVYLLARALGVPLSTLTPDDLWPGLPASHSATSTT